VQEWGYDLAFRYLRDEVQPESSDRIATSMSTASMLYLGRNDAFAIQQGYEEYVVAGPDHGLPVDLWTATPMLTTTTGLTDLLAQSPRVWFITDGWRFQTRYEPDFVLTVLQQMDLAYDHRGVMIFRGEGYSPPSQPAVQIERRAEFDEALALAGFGLSPAAPNPGDDLEIPSIPRFCTWSRRTAQAWPASTNRCWVASTNPISGPRARPCPTATTWPCRPTCCPAAIASTWASIPPASPVRPC
jgi:hypothetical protein